MATLWLLLGLLVTIQAWVYSLNGNRGFDWGDALLYRESGYLLWALLTPFIWRLSRRWPLAADRRVANLLVHLAISLLAAPLHRAASLLLTLVIRHLLGTLPGSLTDVLANVRFAILGGSLDSLLTWWVVLGICFGIRAYRQADDQRHRAARLESQLSEARLTALRMQLHPHFLFNTLHAVSTLMDEDVPAARRMLVRLSDLLRTTLDSADQPEVPLATELATLDRYLAIEQVRFQDRLRIIPEIADETLGAAVPTLILQPLAENAIRHGIAPDSRAGRLELQARRDGAMLEIRIADDGPGAECVVPGVGLGNTRGRLAALYGDHQSLHWGNRPGGGFEVVMRVPFRTMHAGAAIHPAAATPLEDGS